MSPTSGRVRPTARHANQTSRRLVPSFYVIGAGRVGLGLAKLLRARGWRLLGVWNRKVAGRRRAHRFLGIRADGGTLPEALAQADLVLVTVSDAAVGTIGAKLARVSLARGAVIAHTAGALPAAALGRGIVAHLGSVHPLVACSAPAQAARSLPRASFTIEGDATARRLLGRLVRALDGRAFAIPAAGKPRYHAALVMASNLVIALLYLAEQEAKAAGLRHSRSVAALTAGAIELALARGVEAALTGPIVRGDSQTVASHLAVLGKNALPSYVALSQVALAIARRRGLSPSAARVIAKVLRGITPLSAAES